MRFIFSDTLEDDVAESRSIHRWQKTEARSNSTWIQPKFFTTAVADISMELVTEELSDPEDLRLRIINSKTLLGDGSMDGF